MSSMVEAFENREIGTLMLRKKKITIKVIVEYEEDVPDQEMECTFDDMSLIHERGFTSIFFDNKSKTMSNGQERLTLKAWKGCFAFDDFERETEY